MSDVVFAPSGSKEFERLLLRIAGKDKAAFEQLYMATKRTLFSNALLIVKRRHLAEEVVQEAYVRLWLNAAAYRPALAFPMIWMISIARNLAIDVTRKSTREIYSDETSLARFPRECPDALEAIGISEDESDGVKRQRNVFSALQSLDPARRHLVIAAYVHGESRNHLAEHYGLPVNTIKTWIRRTLLEVRIRLQDGIAQTIPTSKDLEHSPMINCFNN